MNAEIVRPVRLQGGHTAASSTACSWSSHTVADADCDILPRPAAFAGRPGSLDRSTAANTVVEVIVFADRKPITVGPRPAEYLCRLAEGWACCEHILRNGARQITDVLVPGDLIPASLLARRETIACGEAHVMILSQDSPQDHAATAFQQIRERARDAELRILRERLVSLGRLDARARVAHLFAELHARLDRSGRVAADAFPCPLTQEHVADVLGLTPVHVNRTLRQLRTEGLLVVRRRRVLIPDIRRLRGATGFDAHYDEYSEASGHDAR